MRALLLVLLACAALAQPIKPPPGAVINWDHPLSRGLVGCWTCPEGSGTLTRDLVRGTQGVLTSGPTWTGPGLGGPGVRYDATNDYTDLGSYVYLTNGLSFTLSWWEWIVADTDEFVSRFAFQKNGDTLRFAVGRIKSSATYRYLLFGPFGGAGNIQATDAPAPSTRVGKWTHFVIMGNPSSTSNTNYLAYCNGVRLTLGDTSPGADTGAVNSRIGYLGAATGFSGANVVLDCVRVYNRLLSATEVRLLYTSPYVGIWRNR